MIGLNFPNKQICKQVENPNKKSDNVFVLNILDIESQQKINNDKYSKILICYKIVSQDGNIILENMVDSLDIKKQQSRNQILIQHEQTVKLDKQFQKQKESLYLYLQVQFLNDRNKVCEFLVGVQQIYNNQLVLLQGLYKVNLFNKNTDIMQLIKNSQKKQQNFNKTQFQIQIEIQNYSQQCLNNASDEIPKYEDFENDLCDITIPTEVLEIEAKNSNFQKVFLNPKNQQTQKRISIKSTCESEVNSPVGSLKQIPFQLPKIVVSPPQENSNNEEEQLNYKAPIQDPKFLMVPVCQGQKNMRKASCQNIYLDIQQIKNMQKLQDNKLVAIDFCIAGDKGIIADRNGKHLELSNMSLFGQKQNKVNFDIQYLLATSDRELRQRKDYKNLKLIYKLSLESTNNDEEGIKYGWGMHYLFDQNGQFKAGDFECQIWNAPLKNKLSQYKGQNKQFSQQQNMEFSLRVC